MATMLQIHQPPAGGGGDTLFASMEAAYATLPEEDRALLRGRVARHESEHIYRGRYADRGVDDADVEYPATTYPGTLRSGTTGRTNAKATECRSKVIARRSTRMRLRRRRGQSG